MKLNCYTNFKKRKKLIPVSVDWSHGDLLTVVSLSSHHQCDSDGWFFILSLITFFLTFLWYHKNQKPIYKKKCLKIYYNKNEKNQKHGTYKAAHRKTHKEKEEKKAFKNKNENFNFIVDIIVNPVYKNIAN